MGAGQRAETKTFDRLMAVAMATVGIGFAVTNKQLTANVATLTIGAHDLAIGDVVLVRGVDSVFDGVDIALTAVGGTTISFALVHADIGSTAVTQVAGVSKRAFMGYKRFTESENFEAKVRALPLYIQGYFWAAIKRVQSQGLNEMKALDFMGEMVINFPLVTNDLNSAWEFALAIRDAMERAENFQVGEFRAKVIVELREVGRVTNGQIAIFDFHGIEVPYA